MGREVVVTDLIGDDEEKEFDPPAPEPAERCPSLELLKDASDDAREIVALIIDTPAHIMGNANNLAPWIRLKRVVDDFRWQHGLWSNRRAERAIEEIKSILKGVAV